MVEVEHGSMHACVYGHGDTTIILAAGAGQSSQTWSTLIPTLQETSRVVTFDRPGLGGSNVGPEPRTPTNIAQELNQTLRGLGIAGRSVFVGHSMGGIHALRYAVLYPDQVAAVVLLDTPPIDFEGMRLELLTDSEREDRKAMLAAGAASAPVVVRQEREGARPRTEWDFRGFNRRIPLFVVVADAQDFGPHGEQESHRRLWVEQSRRWSELSDHASFEIARGSGHMVHQDAEKMVLDAITQAISVQSEH